MLTAAFHRHGAVLCGVCVSGHAEYEDEGQDIACASVSSVVQFTANTMTEIFKIPAKVSVDADTNAISIQLPDSQPDGVRLLEGLLLHLNELKKDFPGNIRIDFTEV